MDSKQSIKREEMGLRGHVSWRGLRPQNNNYRLTTGNFTISGVEWRIRWQCQRLGNGSYLEIMVLDADKDSFVKDIVPRYYLEDVSYLEGPGRFYLKIGVVGQVNWTIYIEEYK